jgi:trk system potassium uptake protein TrkA
MHIIVVGCGRVGSQLANFLSKEGHDVVVVDLDPKAFRRLGSSFNGITQVGNGFDPEDLKKAGIENADAFAAVTDLDNTNVMAAQVAKTLFKVPRVIARIYNPDRLATMERLGLETICGTTMVAKAIENRILGCSRQTLLTLPRGQLELAKVRVPKKLADKTVQEIEKKHKLKVVVLIREGKENIPTSESKLSQGDHLVLVIETEKAAEIEKLFSEE